MVGWLVSWLVGRTSSFKGRFTVDRQRDRCLFYAELPRLDGLAWQLYAADLIRLLSFFLSFFLSSFCFCVAAFLLWPGVCFGLSLCVVAFG